MNVRERVLKANHALLNGSGELAYFEQRGIAEETIRKAYVGFQARAFTYPCIAKAGGLLGIHFKSKTRDVNGKRRQWWEGYAELLPEKGHGKKPNEPAKVIPFGMETLKNLKPGSLAILCCGEEDALSLRQVGYTAISQPGAGLLEPVYAKEFAGLEITVFYDAGEAGKALKDALKLQQAGASKVRVINWSTRAPNGADINAQLVKDAEGFEEWVAKMIAEAKPLESLGIDDEMNRQGKPDVYIPPPLESASWPTLAVQALYGLSGEILEAIEPHTEADSVAVLANLLAAFGNAVGRSPYIQIGADRHHLNLDVALVGETAKGRKGMSWGPIRDLMRTADPNWVDERVQNGLSSGEGLIHAVRDQTIGCDKEGETIVFDQGVEDKRLLIMEGEFASLLKVMRREGNTLSPIVRQAWDGARLQILTHNNPMKATGHHISVIGHITKPELLKHLTETETANGFANRFIWLMVRRSKLLPFGGEWCSVDTAPLARRLRSALEFGKSEAGKIAWGESAMDAWSDAYGPLSEDKPGLLGTLVGRAEAQAVRLAAIYAVMDKSRTIELVHLEGALAIWEYAQESAHYIFGDVTGDLVADTIVKALKVAGQRGLTRTEIRDLFQRHKSAERTRALDLLITAGRIHRELENTGGRPTERWFLKESVCNRSDEDQKHRL